MARLIKSVADVSVTAATQAVDLPDDRGVYTLLNTDTANTAYILFDPETYTHASALVVGTATELQALGAVQVKAGQAVVIGPGIPWFHAVCATGLTATLQVLAGSLTGVTNISANIGNVGILNSSEAEIDPATEGTLNNLDYVVSAAYTATITATAVIPTAFTATLPAGTVRIILIPRGDMYWKIGGAASASTALIGQGFSLNMPATKTLADTIQVYAAGAGVVCDLLVCTPR